MGMETKNKSSELYSRSYQCEIRADSTDEKDAVIIGRPIVFDSKTDIGGYFEEVIDRGALDKTDLTDVRFLVNHDLSKIPLARSRKNTVNSTMQLLPDNDGLAIRVKLDTENNADAKALYSAIERGDISGMSFMFAVDTEEWENLKSDYPTRHIKSISKIVEVSAVTFPAYKDTSIAVNARDKSALDNARLAVDTARKSVDTDLELAKAKNRILGGL